MLYSKGLGEIRMEYFREDVKIVKLKEYMSMQQAGEYLGISRQAVWSAAARGRLTVYQIGESIYIVKLTEIEKYKESKLRLLKTGKLKKQKRNVRKPLKDQKDYDSDLFEGNDKEVIIDRTI